MYTIVSSVVYDCIKNKTKSIYTIVSNNVYRCIKMNIEGHKRAIRESIETIRESIQKGLLKRQRNIGFHCSVCAVDILEIYLHENNLINPGTIIKHDTFSSKRRAEEKIPDFEHKDIIIKLFTELESKRNILCYGKSQKENFIIEYLEIFNKIKYIFAELGVEYE